jgi:hypothetical protein
MKGFVVRRRVGVGAGIGAVAVLALGLAPAVAGHAAAPRAPATHHVSFGAKLTPHLQPSNAFGGQPCQPNAVACTRVMTEARNRGDAALTAEIAPKNGTIGHIKLIGGVPGKFRLQIVKAKPNQGKAKLVRNGPVIHYNGQGTDEDQGPPYVVESFPVKVKVDKGDYLAVKAKEISFEYCSGGSRGQITFEPPLKASKRFKHTSQKDDCLMLLEAVYKK